MRQATRRVSSAFATTLVFGLIAVSGAQAAPAQSVVADATSGPFHLTFHAFRAADAPPTAATGQFDAVTALGPLTLMRLHGPVTCLDIRGNHVGLFYPITSATPSLFSQLGTGIFIYMTVDGAGHATNVQFLPVPIATTSSCAPLPALLPATGSATVTS